MKLLEGNLKITVTPKVKLNKIGRNNLVPNFNAIIVFFVHFRWNKDELGRTFNPDPCLSVDND